MSELPACFFATSAALSALYLLWTTNIMHAAFSLVITFLSIAALYMIAGADFVGATQIMIYVGGIIVIIIFGAMLTNKPASRSQGATTHYRLPALLVSAGVFAALLYAILRMNLDALGMRKTTLKALGTGLMTDYLLPFELAAVLLLIALIGATVIAGRKETKDS